VSDCATVGCQSGECCDVCVTVVHSGFGVLVVSLLASGTQHNGFFPGVKNPEHAFLRKGSKLWVPCRIFTAR
jgi:hypothetical protein